MMKKKLTTIGLAVLTWLIYYLLPYNSSFVERYYYQCIFKYVRIVFDHSFGLLPIPGIYILFAILLFTLIKYLIRFRAKLRQGDLAKVILRNLFVDSITLISALIIAFYWLWGFNYKRISFHEKNHFAPQTIKEDWLFDEMKTVHNAMTHLRKKADFSDGLPGDLESECRNALIPALHACLYYPTGTVRVRRIKPKGSLLLWSTAGIYLPFVSEGHIDDGLHPITKPFTLTHEMTHGYGITEESACNFISFLACVNSESAYLQYSGWMGYFRYLLAACRRTDSARYRTFLETSNPKILSDIQEIYDHHEKYPSILPKLRDLVYNRYLKSHGIKEGTINYSMMIRLAANWQEYRGSYLLVELQD